ncbi:MAG: archease [Candidatus Omnitrophota bacterium]
MKKYELIDHTADIGIKAYGKDLKELFANAAVAMFEIIATRSPSHQVTKSSAKKINIEKEADKLEDLLVSWLDELLYLFSTKNIVFNKFDIKELDEKHIKATASGLDSKNYKLKTEIKAVTYHMLETKCKSGYCEASVIFDV